MDELKVQFELEEPPADNDTLVGEQDSARPDAGLTDSVRDTFPVKPPRLVRLIVDVPLLPVRKPTVEGFAETE